MLEQHAAHAGRGAFRQAVDGVGRHRSEPSTDRLVQTAAGSSSHLALHPSAEWREELVRTVNRYNNFSASLGTRWERAALYAALGSFALLPVSGLTGGNSECVQMARVWMHAWGSRGRGFESRRPDAGHRHDQRSWLDLGDHAYPCRRPLAPLDGSSSAPAPIKARLRGSRHMPVERIGHLAGHRTTALTESVYSQEPRPVLRAGAAVMGELMAGQSSDAPQSGPGRPSMPSGQLGSSTARTATGLCPRRGISRCSSRRQRLTLSSGQRRKGPGPLTASASYGCQRVTA
jgi:hypothetical protein